MNGEYSEKLKSGGDLIVSSTGWCIRYYFPGPDLRYNGTFVTISGSEIDEYISAWERNFEKYLLLKKTIPAGGDFETAGEKGMSIRIGFSEGVCLRSYHMPTSTSSKLAEIIHDYKEAKVRASKIQKLLRSL